MPSAFPAPGAFGVTQRITLLCATPGATIHYTIDGSAPDRSSPFDAYQLPVLEAINDGDRGVSTTYTVKTVAVSDDLAPSDVAMFTYIIDRRAKDTYLTTEVSPGIHMIRDFDDTKMYLVIGSTRALLVDAGAVGAALTAQVLAPPAAQAAVVTAQPVAQIVETSNVAGAVLDAAGASVVEINVTGQATRGPYTVSGTGSGFVVDASGLILTNRNVIASTSDITVQFSAGDERSATVVGSDSANDLALLRVSDMPVGIPAVTLGDSDAVEIGEIAIAIGSPFGLEQTVTQGIISAVDHTYSASGSSLNHLIQTDAPINPGNSGGPLLNAQGQVIGITTLIESPVEGNVGVGFAVPINIAKQQLTQLEAGATLEQGYLGISVQEATDPSQSGVTVAGVATSSGAATAGLQVGDVIVAVDGTAINGYDDLAAQLAGKQPGAQVTLTIQHDGAEQQLVVTLQSATA